jgi:hypothetical protein
LEGVTVHFSTLVDTDNDPKTFLRAMTTRDLRSFLQTKQLLLTLKKPLDTFKTPKRN